MISTDLLLHETSQKLLENFQNTPTHAVLFEGPEGIGKQLLAREHIALFLGQNTQYSRVIEPIKGSISIEAVRDLLSFFQLKVPGKSPVKRVAVVADADTMGLEAQNALLKILEEPPVDSVLILTSSKPQSLLPTIRSRLQILHLPCPTPEQIQAYFAKQGYDEQSIAAATLRGDTNLGKIKHLLAGISGSSTLELVKNALGGTTYDRLLLVDSLSRQKDIAQEFVDTLATVAMASLQTAAKRGANTIERWQGILQSAHLAQQAFDKNGNAKIVLTELMLAL